MIGKRRNKLPLIAALIAAVTSGPIAVADAAEAAPPATVTQMVPISTTVADGTATIGYPYDCPTDGWFCMYSGYFTSMWTRYPAGITRNKCFTANGTVIGGTSTFTYSIVNTTGVRWMWFRDSNCAGAHMDIHPHTAVFLPDGWTGLTNAAFMRTSLTT